MEQAALSKSPLGVIPLWLWREKNPLPTPRDMAARQVAVGEAIKRYEGASFAVPREWMEEVMLSMLEPTAPYIVEVK